MVASYRLWTCFDCICCDFLCCCSDDIRRDPQSMEEAIRILNEIERLAEDCLANGVKVSVVPIHCSQSHSSFQVEQGTKDRVKLHLFCNMLKASQNHEHTIVWNSIWFYYVLLPLWYSYFMYFNALMQYNVARNIW